MTRLVRTLEATGKEKPSDVRRIVGKQTGLSEKQLAQFPVASFSALTDELRSLLKQYAWVPKQ